MKITLKTNNTSVVGGKHDFKICIHNYYQNSTQNMGAIVLSIKIRHPKVSLY